ncbi:MAG: response regulator [Anaerolineales bacterium]|nr:response regulator [Anaerolineales bacterium]
MEKAAPDQGTGEKIRVLIVDDIRETRDNLRKLLQFESDIEVVGQASTGEEGITLASSIAPNVILMDINMPGIDGISASEAITRQVPTAQVIMMSVQSESDYIRRAMLAGARDFLTKPFSSDELIVTIRRVHERSQKNLASMPVYHTGKPGMVQGFPGSSEKKGKVIAFFSPKGGVGCSTIAANLAVTLAQGGQATALMDADLPFGDMGVILDVHGTHSIVDLAERFDEMDSDLLSSVLTSHSSGLKVMLAPPRPEMSELVTAIHLKKIIMLMRNRFEYTIIDTFTSLQDIMLTVLDQADKIVLVATPDIPCIKDTRLFFEVVDQLNYRPDKTLLVLNRVDKHSGITVADVENTLKHPIEVAIPVDSRTVLFSINQGIPFVMRDPSKPVSISINELASRLRTILEQEEKEEAITNKPVAQTRLSRLFGTR